MSEFTMVFFFNSKPFYRIFYNLYKLDFMPLANVSSSNGNTFVAAAAMMI